MKMEMLQDAKGSRTGAKVEMFKEGEVYDLPDDLARIFEDEKMAKRAGNRAKVTVDDGETAKLPGVEK